MYRIGLPLWRQVARLGGHLSLSVDVTHDAEADVFVATSNDLRGLVCAAATLEELRNEVEGAVWDLLAIQVGRRVKLPLTDFQLR